MVIIEFRAFNFETRSIDDEGKFEGYGSVFGSVAQGYNTIMDEGCFKQTINHSDGFFPLLWFHTPWDPVGSLVAEEDKKGLLVHGDVDMDIETGRRMHSGMKKGYIDRMSIGFDRVNEVPAEKSKDNITHITEVALWEISLITRNFAADEEALITEVRAASIGLQRVSKALRAGIADEFKEAVKDLRVLLRPVVQSDETCDIMKEIKALLAEEKAVLTTSVDEKAPTIANEAQSHSLLNELRAFSRGIK